MFKLIRCTVYFTDLDYADDVTLLTEMLQTLVAELLVLRDEAAPLGLQINWSKTKIQQVGEPRPTQSTVQVAAENVDLVDEFIYLGSLISHDGGSEAEILRRIAIARACFCLLEKNIWRSHIYTETKVHLYRTYILPVLLYGCETWTVTKTLAKRLDAFDTWCLRKILRIPYTRHTTNETVRSITGCLPVSGRVKSFRLKFFGHLARSAPDEDHHRVISAALRPPSDWRRHVGHPRTTWLRTIDEDIQPQNFGVHTAWRKARDREVWHQVVSTATLC